jgi:hypothetical protein
MVGTFFAILRNGFSRGVIDQGSQFGQTSMTLFQVDIYLVAIAVCVLDPGSHLGLTASVCDFLEEELFCGTSNLQTVKNVLPGLMKSLDRTDGERVATLATVR